MNAEFYEDEYFISHQYEYFPSAPEAGYEYYEPYPETFPAPSYYEEGAYYDSAYIPEGEPWYGGLWGAFKEAGTQLLKSPLLPSLIKRDRGGLQNQYRIGTPAYDLPPRLDGQLTTPYPRQNTGSIPAPIIKGGISPMILLLGAGAVVLLMMRRK